MPSFNGFLLPTFGLHQRLNELVVQSGYQGAFSLHLASASTKQWQKTARGHTLLGSGNLGLWFPQKQRDSWRYFRSRGQKLKYYGNTRKEWGGVDPHYLRYCEEFSWTTDHNCVENSRKQSVLKQKVLTPELKNFYNTYWILNHWHSNPRAVNLWP